MENTEGYLYKTGILHEIGETKEFNNDFKVREFVIKYTGKYSELFYTFKLKGTNGEESMLDGIQRGEAIKVEAYIDGARKDYNGKYYNDLKAVKITRQEDFQTEVSTPDKPFKTTAEVDDNPENDLPF